MNYKELAKYLEHLETLYYNNAQLCDYRIMIALKYRIEHIREILGIPSKMVMDLEDSNCNAKFTIEK